MDKEQKALKDFLGNLGGNTEEAELNLGQEAEAEPNVEAEAESVEEEKLPFHKDPKVQRYIERQLEKKLKDIQPDREQQFVKETNQDNPYQSYAEKLMGSDTDEAKLKSQILAQTLLDIEKRASDSSYSKFAEEQRQAQAEERQAVEELTDGIERIEENFEVDLSSNSPLARKTRNEFLDFVGRISPKNEYGEVVEYADLEEAFETFQSMHKPEKNDQAKQIAARGMTRSSADATNTPIKRITFENVREMMGLDS